MQNKSDLRKYAKELRAVLNMKSISEEILHIFCSLDLYRNAKKIAAYYPFGSEPDIKKLFSDKTKEIFIPKISQNDEMNFYKFTSDDVLTKNKYGIMEPNVYEDLMTVADIMILPALMADKYGYRLGYGKGYYDKFLSENKFSGIKVILIAEELITDKLPSDNFDIPADLIITQSDIYKINWNYPIMYS